MFESSVLEAKTRLFWAKAKVKPFEAQVKAAVVDVSEVLTLGQQAD